MASNKLLHTFEEAVADIPDGATIMVGGFGSFGEKPENLLKALRNQGTKNLTIIGNNPGIYGKIGRGSPGGKIPFIDEEILVENGQVKKAICTVPISAARSYAAAFQRLYTAGKVELELVPMGTLAERIRAAGAGLGAFYTPTGVGTVIAQGKETRIIDGREMLLEFALKADFALIKAYRADRMGNLTYRGTMRVFNADMAPAARVTIAEVEELVEIGQLDMEIIVTPGIYVKRLVKIPKDGK
jgi:3-oxoadipate CoA-transferase alpha subunit